MQNNLPLLQDLGDLSGARVLVRVDFNVPVSGGRVVDDFRIKAALPTIEFLKKAGAKVVLASHFGSKEGNDFKLVSDHLKNIVPHTYIPSIDMVVIGEHIGMMALGDVALLTNLRFWRGEETAEKYFAIDFCRLFDFYVNEAFAVSHRAHASIVLFPTHLKSAAGLRFFDEVKNLSLAFEPEEPFLVILGGAKFETKEPLISKFLSTATNVFIGGALANDFFKQQGLEVGISLLSSPPLLISEDIFSNPKLLLPIDVTVMLPDKSVVIKKPDQVMKDEKIVDIGPASVEMLQKYAENAKLIIWNGPMGIYEEGIVTQTEELGIAIAESEGV